MTENFNFGGFENSSAINNSKVLKPWGIYDVTFNGIEKAELKGKQDPNSSYATIKISFSGEEGTFSKNLFIPSRPEDNERREYENQDGSKRKYASAFEEFKWRLLQLAQVVNPTGFTKLQKLAPKIKTMDQFIDLIFKVINEGKGVKTKLKLIGSNRSGSVYADIPRVAAINHSDELFIGNNFVGDKVAFSSYEAQQAAAYQAAKPTEMPKNDSLKTDSLKVEEDNGISDDLDFAKLAETL